MKISVCGKGGSGKSTIVALLDNTGMDEVFGTSRERGHGSEGALSVSALETKENGYTQRYIVQLK